MTKDEVRELIQQALPDYKLSGEVLEYLTEKVARTAKTEEEATEQVKDLTPTDIALSYADSRVNQAQAKWKRRMSEQRKADEAAAAETAAEGAEEATAAAKAPAADPNADRLAALEARLRELETERRVESRRAQIDQALEGLPDYFRAPFAHIDTESLTDDAFDHLMGEIKGDTERFRAEAPKGAFTPPPAHPGGIARMQSGEPKPSAKEIEELVRLTDR